MDGVNRAAEGEGERILIIDDQALRRAGLAALLRHLSADTPIATSEHDRPPAAGEVAEPPDLVILCVAGRDLRVPAEKLRLEELKRRFPEARLVLLSDSADLPQLIAAWRHGVHGYLTMETPAELTALAIRFVMRGGCYFPPNALVAASQRENGASGHDLPATAGPPPLTARQTEVLDRLRAGKPNRAIADDLGLPEATVKLLVRQIMTKLGLKNRTQIALWARKNVAD